MAKTQMFVWRELSELRDYRDGLLCVIAESKAAAITLAVDEFCGTSQNSDTSRESFQISLETLEPEVIKRGVAYVLGGS